MTQPASSEPSTPRRLPLILTRHETALVGITAIWGMTFLIVRMAMTVGNPLFFVGLRFAVAALATALVWRRRLGCPTWRELGAGTAIGISIFIGYTLQTYGLKTIPSSTSAFITAFYVPLVPLLQWAVMGRPPRLMSWGGIALAFAGLMLLAGPGAGPVGFGRGELLTVVGTLGIATEVVLISRFAGTVDLGRVTVVQLAVTSLVAFGLMAPMGEAPPHLSWLLVGSAGGLGLASALIQSTTNWAQRWVSPTRATVIYAGEPVWAGIVGRVAGERLPALALVGAVLVVTGVMISELRPPRWVRRLLAVAS